VIAILGRGADLVKGKNFACDSAYKTLTPLDLLDNQEVGRLWKNCCYSDPGTVRFPSKGAEHLGLLIADPQQLKGVVAAGLSELPAENSEASKPYSHDYTEGHQHPGENEDIKK
jgi:hypothetical protein